ncbi:MAG: Obg family GTPase CgtA, partial [Clostridia bacterium]
DLAHPGDTYIVAKGGRGGRGNIRFANATRQAPDFAEPGMPGEERMIELELKVLADVGLLGFPNVGKSTLLSVVTKAKPKIANYHFTTLSPNLGVVKYFDSSFVVADIPGLIEGASDGLGLGHEFLRHVERTRMLVHVLDISGSEHRDPLSDFALINKELANYNKDLTKLPQIVVANKMDMPDAEANLARFKAKYGKKYIIVPMMAAIHEGVDQLLSEIIKIYANLPPVVYQEYEPYQFYKEDATQYEITKIDGGVYEVTGGFVNSLARKVSLDDVDSFRYFQRAIAEKGIIDALRLKGARDGDVIIMGDVEFDFID